MSSSSEPECLQPPSSAKPTEALFELLRFGALLLGAGSTAFRVRRSMELIAKRMGFSTLSVQLGLTSIIATGQMSGETTTLIREIKAFGVNSQQIRALEELANTTPSSMSAGELATKLDDIAAVPPRYSIVQTGAAVGLACGAFAILNGGIGLEVLAAIVGGALGQCLKSVLLRRHYNQYAVTVICAVLASGVYCLLAAAFLHAGLGVPRHTIGFISSVLFLIPGFPLIAALLDLLQYEMTAALTRLAYASMLLLSAALGLSAVIAMVGFTVEPALPRELSETMIFLLRTAASFVAGSGFAVLFNCSPRLAIQVGLLSIIGNAVRLMLHDAGLGLPLATFSGAFLVGLAASLASRWLNEPRIVLTIPGVIMMVPGMYAFNTLVYFDQGEILPALKAMVLFGFVVGAMALGLAAGRFVTQPEWLKD